MLPYTRYKLNQWKSKGLISEQDYLKIEAFENQGLTTPWVIFGLMTVGGVALIVGIISIVASNWEAIPTSIKISSYFLLHLGFALGIIKYGSVWSPKIHDLAIILFCCFFTAGLGLYSQVFQTKPNVVDFIGLMCLLSFFPLIVARTPFPQYLFAVACQIFCFSKYATKYLPRDNQELYLFNAALTLGLFLVLVGHICKQSKIKSLLNFSSPFKTVGWINLVIGSTIFANFVVFLNIRTPAFSQATIQLVYPFALLLILSILFVVTKNRENAKSAALVPVLFFFGVGTSLCVINSSLIFSEIFNGYSRLERQIIGAFLFYFIGLLFAAIAVIKKKKLAFEAISILLTIRIIFVYFEVFGSLLQTGISLVVSGLVILGVAYTWYRWRRELNSRLGLQ